jgi:hypothetical protein
MNRVNGTDKNLIDLAVVGLKSRVDEVLRKRWQDPADLLSDPPPRHGQMMMFAHQGTPSSLDEAKVIQTLADSYMNIVDYMGRFGVKVERKDFTLRFVDSGKREDGVPACRFLLEWKRSE